IKQTHVVDSSDTTSLGKKFLRRSIQVVLAGSMLASGMASAVLLDHGPGDANLLWPQWYRDTNGLAIGLCKSTALSPNVAVGGATGMCFPPAFDPAGFAGNIGPEMFYNMAEFSSKTNPTGTDFQYRIMAALEASYLPGLPAHGTETVFARIRISINFNDPNKSGTYTVTHPFGSQVFPDLQATDTNNIVGNQAALFFTADVPLAAINNFDLALGGALGPFLQWDTDQDLLTVGAESFVGDPNVPHTFSGSPFGTNFLRIDGPAGSQIGFDANGVPQDFIQVDLANIIGQKWTAPIATATKIDSAYMTRKPGGVNAIDVWATSATGQRLIMTGTGMPSLQMFTSVLTPGKYHGHVEYPATQAMPAQIKVTNLSSNPVLSATSALEDGVEITQATFDTNTRLITVVAQSSDEVGLPRLTVQGIPGIPTAAGVAPAVTGALSQGACPTGVVNPSICFTYSLPANVEPPESISVVSGELGLHADHLLSIVGNSQAPTLRPTATVFTFPVSSGGSTPLTSANGTLPLDAMIIQQPANGIVALNANGVWTFTAKVGAIAGGDNFQYVRQAADGAPVSNVAVANLTLAFNAAAPTVVADQYAAQTGTTKSLFILQNDKPASANPADAIRAGSVAVVSRPSGTATTNPSGAITYTAGRTAGADSFTYTVTNSSTPAIRSTPTLVQVTNFAGAEAVAVTKPTYTIASGKWVIVGTTSWFGANLTTSTATCWTGIGATPTASTLIGNALIDNTGKYTVVQVANAPVGVNNGNITCQTSNGGKGVGSVVAK
ncbi:MAG: Ig-like domain-containing protein, partial [Methylococcaceae bacterium]